MNQKPATVQADIIEAFVSGLSVRGVVKKFRCAKNTASRYRKLALDLGWEMPMCTCGRPSGHRGWCSERVRNSPARQTFLSRWHGKKIVATHWIPVTENTPQLGQRVAVMNGIRCWLTTWKSGLVHPYGQWPVTHYTPDTEAFTQLDRPYPVQTMDCTRIKAFKKPVQIDGEMRT
jgi:hypothetical protein